MLYAPPPEHVHCVALFAYAAPCDNAYHIVRVVALLPVCGSAWHTLSAARCSLIASPFTVLPRRFGILVVSPVRCLQPMYILFFFCSVLFLRLGDHT
jgi:hypothetical protein